MSEGAGEGGIGGGPSGGSRGRRRLEEGRGQLKEEVCWRNREGVISLATARHNEQGKEILAPPKSACRLFPRWPSRICWPLAKSPWKPHTRGNQKGKYVKKSLAPNWQQNSWIAATADKGILCDEWPSTGSIDSAGWLTDWLIGIIPPHHHGVSPKRKGCQYGGFAVAAYQKFMLIGDKQNKEIKDKYVCKYKYVNLCSEE